MDLMLQPPRGREERFYEWEGRRKGRGRHCADACASSSSFFFFPCCFLNGREERSGEG